MEVEDPRKPETQKQLTATAAAYFQKGNWIQAERICRFLLDLGVSDPMISVLLGNVAGLIGEHDFARQYLDDALRLDPKFLPARQLQASVEKATRAGEREAGDDQRPRYLLIKAWGFGFWADVDHVLGALLVAEMTHRTPVVYWGTNSLFKSDDQSSAFELFFEPVSEVTIRDLCDAGLSFFPPKWNAQNLLAEEVNKWQGECSRIAGLHFLNRPDDVLVSDFHIHVNDMVPWIPRDHPLYGTDAPDISQNPFKRRLRLPWRRDDPLLRAWQRTFRIYRQLFQRYLQLKPGVAARIETFWQEKLAGAGPVLAVHVRGSDKVKEYPGLDELNERYARGISERIARHPGLKIFLLTDSETTFDEYRRRYGDRLIYTDSIRSRSDVAVHYQGLPGQRIGMEVLVDTYLAARCDYFLGCGMSNVSTTVRHMKDWTASTYELLYGNFLLERNLVLHDW